MDRKTKDKLAGLRVTAEDEGGACSMTGTELLWLLDLIDQLNRERNPLFTALESDDPFNPSQVTFNCSNCKKLQTQETISQGKLLLVECEICGNVDEI
mgnify:CR=1 FL=1